VNAQQKFVGANYGDVNGSSHVQYKCQESALNVHGVHALCNIKAAKDGYFVLTLLRAGYAQAANNNQFLTAMKATLGNFGNTRGEYDTGIQAESNSHIWGILPVTAGGTNAQMLEIAPKTSRNMKKGDILCAFFITFEGSLTEHDNTIVLTGFASS